MSSRSSEVTRDTQSLNGHMFFPVSLPAHAYVHRLVQSVFMPFTYLYPCFTVYMVRIQRKTDRIFTKKKSKTKQRFSV